MLAPPTPPPARTIRPGAAAKPFSVRLTEDERRLLLERADKLPLGVFIRDLILADISQTLRRRVANPIKDHEALARVLAAFGQSRIANNLNQLAKAVNTGSLPVTPETEAELKEACREVSALRDELLRALGKSPGDGP